MTRDEYAKGTKRIREHFPILAEIAPAETWKVWFESVKYMSPALWAICVQLVCRTLPQWNRGMNLAGVIAGVLPEARERLNLAMDRVKERNHDRLLPDQIARPGDGKKFIELYQALMKKRLCLKCFHRETKRLEAEMFKAG